MGEDFRFRDSRIAFSVSIAVGSVGHTSTVVRESPSVSVGAQIVTCSALVSVGVEPRRA